MAFSVGDQSGLFEPSYPQRSLQHSSGQAFESRSAQNESKEDIASALSMSLLLKPGTLPRHTPVTASAVSHISIRPVMKHLFVAIAYLW